jgi:hypothetical protein
MAVWEYRAYTNLKESIQLHSIEAEISMADIYVDVDFMPFDEENWRPL